MKKLLLAALLLTGTHLFAQDNSAAWFNLTRAGFNEKNALATTAFVEQRWRVPGNTGFNESIYKIEEILKKAGYVLQKANEAEGPLTYRLEKRPLKNKAWDPLDASITIAGEQQPLLEFKTNRNMLAINSASTPEGGVTADVVMLTVPLPKTLEGIDVKGKIVFAEMSSGRLFNMAMSAGAIGVMGYSMPKYTQPEKYQTSIQFSGISNNSNGGWAVNMSYAAKERLKKAIAKGPLKLHVAISTKLFDSEELTIVANVRGTVNPDERLVYSAHVQEPGANDNATGVGTLSEMARVTANLVKSGKLKPQRTMTFLWGNEIVSTGRYITEDKERAKGILWGMSLDMVGENTAITGGSFLIEKMPDPSAIWTRGTDKHSEWGAGEVAEKDLFPHYYNDFIMRICNTQGKFANWTVNYNPFEGGSDHTPFLRNNIPGLLMWHFTDAFYHTDNDRLDKVSATTMKNVGISALTAGLTLINADEQTAMNILGDVKAAAALRMKTEFELSKKIVAEGGDLEKEKHILNTWSKYYTASLATTSAIPVQKSSTRIGSAIKVATLALEKQTEAYLAALK
ncbi:M28 family peptidase [Pedobacter duraquae]|uniref:Peptidase M28-like protein n=1 Tax=Pedobacter duraquae TaxID=425511 RepID=A0A4R6IDH8_9SPHI|nr:M28 family peptidase [Pedobacter duraquae]TDO19691.1 peptidase M28-like protein [Pedobacter duraquae]